MRMRRKRNLDSRIEKCEGFFLDLNDEDLFKALGFVREQNNLLIPTITGLLLIGKISALKQYIPTKLWLRYSQGNIDYYRNQTKKAIENLKYENTKKILPDVFKLINEAAQRGDWSCRVTQDNNIFKLIDKSNVSQILKEQGFDTKYVTICRDESVYQITWGA